MLGQPWALCAPALNPAGKLPSLPALNLPGLSARCYFCEVTGCRCSAGSRADPSGPQGVAACCGAKSWLGAQGRCGAA